MLSGGICRLHRSSLHHNQYAYDCEVRDRGVLAIHPSVRDFISSRSISPTLPIHSEVFGVIVEEEAD